MWPVYTATRLSDTILPRKNSDWTQYSISNMAKQIYR